MNPKSTVLSSKELTLVLQEIINKSGFIITSFSQNENGFNQIGIKNKHDFNLNVNIRNIASAYLPNKPHIKRRQVGKMHFDTIPINQQKQLSMLLGVGRVNDRYVLACWNPFYFLDHSTNRSCYVLQESLEFANENGLYDGIDCKTPVLVCSENGFEKLIKVYLERNVLD
jgi:hypothetical protein